jgi:hypothetical protein
VLRLMGCEYIHVNFSCGGAVLPVRTRPRAEHAGHAPGGRAYRLPGLAARRAHLLHLALLLELLLEHLDPLLLALLLLLLEPYFLLVVEVGRMPALLREEGQRHGARGASVPWPRPDRPAKVALALEHDLKMALA